MWLCTCRWLHCNWYGLENDLFGSPYQYQEPSTQTHPLNVNTPAQHTHTQNLKWGPACCAKTWHFPFSASWSVTLRFTTMLLCWTISLLQHILIIYLNWVIEIKHFPTLNHPHVISHIAFFSVFSSIPITSFSVFSPSFFLLAALASSCRHPEQTQHTSPHQGHSIGTRVSMWMSVCVCLEQSLQWGHKGWERWPTLIYCRLKSSSTH